jgi:hypothetical protein
VEKEVLLRWSRPQQDLALFMMMMMMMICFQCPITESTIALTISNIPGKGEHLIAAGKQGYRPVFINVVQIFLFYLPLHVTLSPTCHKV